MQRPALQWPDCASSAVTALLYLFLTSPRLPLGHEPTFPFLTCRRYFASPQDSDAYFALGNAIRGQASSREAEALAAYEAAVAITPTDYESHIGRAECFAALGEPLKEAEALRAALAINGADVKAWINIGVAYSQTDDTEKAEAAFREAVEMAPNDARPSLNLGRYLAKLSRPAEAIDMFYSAAVVDAEYFEEVKLGVGTARAQQGRLREATEAFGSASRMSPKNEKLKDSLVEMGERAEALEAMAAEMVDAAGELCGTPCQVRQSCCMRARAAARASHLLQSVTLAGA